MLLNSTVIVGGDIDIHVEDITDADCQRLASVFDIFDVQQHVTGPTHLLGGTLELVATFCGRDVNDLCVDPAGIISDHSLITCSLPSTRRDTSAPTRVVRAWRRIFRSAIFQAIRDSSLSRTPSSLRTAEELFAEYDTVLRSIADHGDQLAPAHQVCSRVRPHAPWFDAECRATRRDCRSYM